VIHSDTVVLYRKDGNINICKISEIDDSFELLSFNKEYKKIWSKIKTIEKSKINSFVKVRGSGSLEILLSPDHYVFVFGNDEVLTKKMAKNLVKDDMLVSFTTNTKGTDFSFDLSEYTNKREPDKSVRQIKITPDIMRLIGFYLSEGSLYIKENGVYTTTFTFNITETKYCNDISDILEKELKLSSYEFERPESNSRQLKVNNKQLAYFLLDNFGKLAHFKSLPGWVFDLSKENYLELMRGYIGDARICANEVIYTSCNRHMIEQFCYLSKLHGLDCRMVHRYNDPHQSPQGTIIKGGYAYDLKFSSNNRDFLLKEMVSREKFKSLNQDLIPRNTFLGFGGVKSLINTKKAISKRRVLSQKNIGKELFDLCKSDIHITRIKEIDIEGSENDCYDIKLENTDNFACGNYPIILGC
jgi:intein/homing endonuclease